jgi:hypothetical protein
MGRNAAAVDVGGVDKSHVEVQAAIERGKRFGVVDVTVDRCQRPAPNPIALTVKSSSSFVMRPAVAIWRAP